MGKGRAPCCDKEKVKKGAWTPAEDLRLTAYIHKHGHSNWRALPTLAGLMRCGKSCRLRWINYLRPDVKRGNFTPQEELTLINLHNSFGNKWSKIASYLPGRTDNEIKNVWNTNLKKRLTNPNLVDDHNCHEENEAKEYSTTTYSTSLSCTSSSITSAEDCNVQNALWVVQDSDIQNLDPNSNKNPEFQKIQDLNPNPNKNPEFQKIQDLNPNPNKNPEFQKIQDLNPNSSENPEFLKIESTHPIQDHKENPTCDSPTSSHASDYPATNRAKDDGKIEIPVDLDIDIWELIDSLGEEDPNLHMDANEEGCNINEWFRFLEDEVGTTPQEPEEIEYFPMWPFSPSNF